MLSITFSTLSNTSPDKHIAGYNFFGFVTGFAACAWESYGLTIKSLFNIK